MAKKKDFSGAFEAAAMAASESKARGKQEEASQEEKTYRQAAGITQGRKGCKLHRINMGFTTENYKFIKILSRASGRTMTMYVNEIISDYIAEHPEHLERALEFLEDIGADIDEEEEKPEG